MFRKTLNQKNRENRHGFTAIEIILAIAVAAILAAIAVPSVMSYRYSAQISAAINEIKLIESAIVSYVFDNSELPDSLADIGKDQMTDPWGNPYRYLRINGGTTPGLNGLRRRDKNANPVNSDYDLYSMGRDGLTSAQFMAQRARDDIVRANDGAYYGLAEEH
jgi:general secretion pathway protein G